jgi:hypothetical protein
MSASGSAGGMRIFLSSFLRQHANSTLWWKFASASEAVRRVTATTEDARDGGLGCACTAKTPSPDFLASCLVHDLSAFFLTVFGWM